ncbi:response regulator transcription factor [Variovorax boronicumulans]|uniref:response regulator transcription factor n=1 Tax=Variovorax boronicumulans TaxID=436515 RepID=UPI0033920386
MQSGSSQPQEQPVSPALAAGAAGYLFTEANEAELALLMFSIERGDAPGASRMARHILGVIAASARSRPPAPQAVPALMAKGSHRQAAASPSVRLSPREQQVLQLVSRGWSNRKIAEALIRSASTIDTQVKSIYRKLGVKSRVQAVHEATRLGLLNWNEGEGAAH